MSVKPVPEGYHSVTPYLIVDGAATALEFYARAFGAAALRTLRAPKPRRSMLGSKCDIDRTRADDETAASQRSHGVPTPTPRPNEASPAPNMAVNSHDASFRLGLCSMTVTHNDLVERPGTAPIPRRQARNSLRARRRHDAHRSAQARC